MTELFINQEVSELIKERLQGNTRDELDNYYRGLVTKVVYFDWEKYYIKLQPNILTLYSGIIEIFEKDIVQKYLYNDMAAEFRESIRKTDYHECLELSSIKYYRKHRPLKYKYISGILDFLKVLYLKKRQALFFKENYSLQLQELVDFYNDIISNFINSILQQ